MMFIHTLSTVLLSCAYINCPARDELFGCAIILEYAFFFYLDNTNGLSGVIKAYDVDFFMEPDYFHTYNVVKGDARR